MSQSSTVVQLEQLTKQYGDHTVLRGVDLKVKQGEIVGLLGSNGAGKTTTLNILLGLTSRSGGRVELFGSTVNYPLPDNVKTRIGVAFQSTGLYPELTVLETCRLMAQLYDRSRPIEDVLRSVELWEQRGQRFDRLSGGQQQRLIVALSLINDPDLLLLDEPTIGLDPGNRREIWQLIRSLKANGKTIVLTSHYMDEIQELCDRISILHHGTIIAAGRIDDIVAQLGQDTSQSLEDIIIQLNQL